MIYKAEHEPRRNQKRYLKDLGGTGSAEELDAVLDIARSNADDVAEAQRLNREREITAKTVDAGVDAQVAEMLAAIRLRMQDSGMTQSDLAAACGWKQPLIAAYLSGSKLPGAGNLAKIAEALGARWRLVDV